MIWRVGLGGVEETKKELLVCCQSGFILGVPAVGELRGGVTGALMEPPGM